MKDHDEQVDEVSKTLKKFSHGLTFDELMIKCTNIEKEAELSRAIHRGTQLSLFYKKGNKYYPIQTEAIRETQLAIAKAQEHSSPLVAEMRQIIESTPELKKLQVEEPSAEQVQVQELKLPEVRIVPVKKNSLTRVAVSESKEKAPYGLLKVTKVTGAVVYALYRFREHEPLSYEDIEILTGLTRLQIYNAIAYLTDFNYIEKVGEDYYAKHKWTGLFCYPFPFVRPNDKDLIKYQPHEFPEVKKNWISTTRAARKSRKGVTTVNQPAVALSLPVDPAPIKVEPDSRLIEIQQNVEQFKKLPGPPDAKEMAAYIDSKIDFHFSELRQLCSIRQALSEQ